MGYDNAFNPKLAIKKVMSSLPRNTLSKYTSRSVQHEEEQSCEEEEAPDDEGDKRGRAL